MNDKLPIIIVGITGYSCSGKTTLAKILCDKIKNYACTNINLSADILSVDQFYKEKPTDISADKYNYDHPKAFDYESLKKVLTVFKQGEECSVPGYDYTTHKPIPNKYILKPCSILIVEGIMLAYQKEIRDLLDLLIYVETDSDVCLARRIIRDQKERNRDVNEIIQRYIGFVKQGLQYTKEASAYAQYIVNNTNQITDNILITEAEKVATLCLQTLNKYLVIDKQLPIPKQF